MKFGIWQMLWVLPELFFLSQAVLNHGEISWAPDSKDPGDNKFIKGAGTWPGEFFLFTVVAWDIILPALGGLHGVPLLVYFAPVAARTSYFRRSLSDGSFKTRRYNAWRRLFFAILSGVILIWGGFFGPVLWAQP